jgi:glycosyltransferase EpsF
MKRILHVVGSMDRAGAETMLMNLYRAIDHREFQFDFLYLTNNECDYDKEIENLGGVIYRIPDSRYLKQINRFYHIIKLFMKLKPKVVHGHTLYSSSLFMLLASICGVKGKFAHSHNTSSTRSNSLFGRVYGFCAKAIISKWSNNFIACGIQAGEFLFPNVEAEKIQVFPNAINVNVFSKAGVEHKEYFSELYNVKKDCVKIIQVGRLQKVKNHKFSLAIAKELLIRDVSFKMYFIGDGAKKEEINSAISKLALSNHVTVLGVRTDIDKLMSGADVMLMPSLYEGFPVVLVESQTVGLPALISDVISPEVDLGVNLVNFLSLNESKSVWCDKILELKAANEISVEARINIVKNRSFDVTTNVSKLEALYRPYF